MFIIFQLHDINRDVVLSHLPALFPNIQEHDLPVYNFIRSDVCNLRVTNSDEMNVTLQKVCVCFCFTAVVLYSVFKNMVFEIM